MSDLEKKAKDYARRIKDYENLKFKPVELSKYHSLSEQEFDKHVSKLEDALQDDISQYPEVVNSFDKLLQPLKRLFHGD
ncbi:MAG: hypothetical protein ACOC3V_04580 [bacterium]